MTTNNTVTLNGKEYDTDTLLDKSISQEVDSKLSESKSRNTQMPVIMMLFWGHTK
jgi:hypothetical protein